MAASVPRRAFFVLAAVLTMLVLVAACARPQAPATEGPQPDRLPELIVAIPSEIEGTDIQQVSWAYYVIHGLIGTPPMSLGLKNSEVLPWGARRVEVSADGREIRLTYDAGRTFHNGVAVTAEAIKRSIERYLEVSPYAFDYDPVEAIVVEGDTLILKLVEAAPGLMVVLGSVYAAPVEAGAAAEAGTEAFHRKAVGDGPFIVEEWVDGSHITLVRNDTYRDYLPFADNNGPFRLSKVTVRFIPEGFTRVSELRAGRVHMITDVPDELLQTLKEDPKIVVHGYLVPNVRHLQMHTERFPFDDRRVRLAVAYAIDRDEIARALNETVQPVYGVVGEAMISHDAATEADLRREFAFNPQRAAELLAEAGWTKGSDGILQKGGRKFSFTLVISSDSSADKKAGPVIQAQLGKLGIDVQLREYEGRYVRQLTETKDYEAVLRNWSWLDPGGVWPASLRSDGRFTQWSHPDLDALIDAAITVPDEDERARKWGAVSRRVWVDVPIVPLWSDRAFIATRDTVSGLVISVDGITFFHDITVRQGD